MNDVKMLYDLWLAKTADNPEINAELLAVKGNDEEITDRFYRNLEFGGSLYDDIRRLYDV